MKLFTIGDSISQGFMSLAAARTELSYSTLIARCLGLNPGTDDYPIPVWGKGGLPVNIESLLRELQSRYGNNIFGPIEWAEAPRTIGKFLDSVEEHYERGEGNIALPQAGNRHYFPNVSVAGFTVADAWKVTPAWCVDRIANDVEGSQDGFFALPNRGFERIAHAVLNPSRNPAFNDYSQLRWLRHHHENEGVENLILWLGSNNALGTVVRMEIRRTAETNKDPLNMSVEERNHFNLWSPPHFEAEYRMLMEQVHEILSNGSCDCRVFIGTVPPVTVAPLARGVGNEIPKDDPFKVVRPKAIYYDRYTYFLFDLDYARRSGNSLTGDEAHEIDRTIAAYNDCIKELVREYNGKPRGKRKVDYVVVDIADQLLRLAFKRNNGKPTYQLPEELVQNVQGRRTINTVYYHVDRDGIMKSGGVFSLDGVHPTAIGHGLIAKEFLIQMQDGGVEIPRAIDWNAVIASDSLYTNLIPLMPELYDNTRLAEILLKLLRLP
ncbi:hypothetical protein GGE65_008436 [Skermanella aerolata]|uniref:hypothetical protein n=1 Tax=Skermanella aerolata TaxID=393310 RepID=UPI003D1CC8D5